MLFHYIGLRPHGGTPPLAPDHVKNEAEIPEWAYRWVVVCYPQAAVLGGSAAINIAADNDHWPIQLMSDLKVVSVTEDDLYVLFQPYVLWTH